MIVPFILRLRDASFLSLDNHLVPPSVRLGHDRPERTAESQHGRGLSDHLCRRVRVSGQYHEAPARLVCVAESGIF